MANTQDFTNFFKDLPTAIDTAALTDAWKTSATFGERFAAIALDAAKASNDITKNTVEETLAQLRDVTKAQDAPADYAKVFNDFGAAQAELLKGHFEALGEVAKQTQSDTAELLSSAGQQVSEQSKKAANDAGTKAKAAVNKAAKAA